MKPYETSSYYFTIFYHDWNQLQIHLGMLVLAVFNIHSMKHAILICELRKDLRLKDRNLKIRNLTWVWDPDPWQNQIKSSTKTQP